jgi:hypothetical protein
LNVGAPDISSAEPLPFASATELLQPEEPASIPASKQSAMVRAQGKVMVISCESWK